MATSSKQKPSIVSKFLNGVEWVGNKLPDPTVLFFLMSALLLLHGSSLYLMFPLNIQVTVKLFISKVFSVMMALP